MKKKKKKKKIIIGAAVVLVAAGGISVAAQRKSGEDQIPQVPVVTVQTGDVEEIVDASGTVGSEEEKTYYSPVNAQIKKVAFSQGDVVKKGTKLIEFDTKDLEKDNQKAELNLKSTKYDTKDTVNKSDKADQKQKDAKKKVQELEKKVKDKKAYVASLKSQISAATTRAQQEAAAQAAAQAAAEAQAQQAAAQAEAQKQQEIQNKYQAALYTYQKETLPQYQQKLSELSSAYTQAQTAYNQADTAYQMAFAAWQADPSEENTQELSTAEENRNQAQISRDQAKEAYEDYKQQTPAMPNMADFSTDNTGSDLGFSDGTDVEDTEEEVETDTSYSGSSETVTADTSALESAMEAASDELAELQSDLASEKAIAEADSTSLTKEERKKLKVADNLSELDAKSAKELVEEGKKGITAEFNGIVSKADLKNGEAVTQGMELFTIQNTDKASVDVTLSKYDYDTVKEGQKAEITLGDNTYEGTVTRMSHIAVQNEKGTPVISATVSIDDPDDDIFLGVDAKVKIHAASAKDVVTLPVEVVNIGKDGSFCYVIENGLVTRRNITTGISSEDYIEITDGIEAGEEVISDLGDYTEGMAVQAEPQEQTGEDADE
ncbi:efflux RND transporter periplasmic adaptor subunit [Ruminococcus sp. AF21-42]|nr:efflux RND transporter periplasmic adaptor subunit [Ruminococcus sp. AF21-42]